MDDMGFFPYFWKHLFWPHKSVQQTEITAFSYIGIWITAFGVEQQTPSVAPIVETSLRNRFVFLLLVVVVFLVVVSNIFYFRPYFGEMIQFYYIIFFQMG